ncbi:hypothetical protein EsH8_IV_001365 [Colletotrichum jinshuiense]
MKLLAYQTAYDSANNDCSPSYAFQAGANTTTLTDIAMIAAALNNGWYVVSSDYESLTAAYSSGLQAGYATLDSVRVALSTESTTQTGLSAKARYAMCGYSGGSIASEWGAELQPTYAPELALQGAALGGLIANTGNVVPVINKGTFAGLAFGAIKGLAAAYPEAAALFESQWISDAKRSEFLSVAGGCLSQASSGGPGKDLFSYFKDGSKILQSPVLTSILNSTGLMGTHGVPKMPIYIYKAEFNEISPAADNAAYVSAICAQGAVIEHRRNLVGEHITEDILGAAGTIEWVNDRLT